MPKNSEIVKVGDKVVCTNPEWAWWHGIVRVIDRVRGRIVLDIYKDGKLSWRGDDSPLEHLDRDSIAIVSQIAYEPESTIPTPTKPPRSSCRYCHGSGKWQSPNTYGGVYDCEECEPPKTPHPRMGRVRIGQTRRALPGLPGDALKEGDTIVIRSQSMGRCLVCVNDSHYISSDCEFVEKHTEIVEEDTI